MRPHTKSIVFFAFFLLLASSGMAQEKLILKDGERVVLLGSGLIENEQKYGWLEYVLSSTWADKYISFRNLGWAGDTVYGESRTYFTTPPTPFELLIEQVKAANPTVVFLAYGQVESEMGIQGIETFTLGMSALLDSIKEMGSKVIVLNPIKAEQIKSPESQKTGILDYQQSISEMARQRGLKEINVGTFLASLESDYWETSVLLSEKGYARMAEYIARELGYPLARDEIHIAWKDQQMRTDHQVTKLEWDSREVLISLSLSPKRMILNGTGTGTDVPRVFVRGLKKGKYGLRIDGEIVAIGSHQEWEEGVDIKQGAWIRQTENLRQLIQKKDEIYFRKYRPQNRTYILGFRAYEQGRHEEDLKDLGLLIAWLDGQIHQEKQPKTHQLELFSIQ